MEFDNEYLARNEDESSIIFTDEEMSEEIDEDYDFE